MDKRLLLHDLSPEQISATFGTLPDDVLELTADPAMHHCIGCFRCWLETPGVCAINDAAQPAPAMLASSNEFIIISRSVYGGFSPDVKGVLDRSIGYIMPFFRIIEGEMHHTLRYENPFRLTVHFYGAHIVEEDKEIARALIPAMALNLGAEENQVSFYSSPKDLQGALS